MVQSCHAWQLVSPETGLATNRGAEGAGRRLCLQRCIGGRPLSPREFLTPNVTCGYACRGERSMNTVIRTTALAACMILSLQSFRARAAAGPGDPLDEVVVTATRVAEPASLALEPVLVIDRAELEDSVAIDLGDVLRYHAGFDIGRNGGPGQPLSLFIRGTNSDQSIVMIDGVRVNSGTQALAPLMNLSPESFESIEIVEGPRSTIYGTDAIGGVVNLITRTGGASGADLMLGYGRYGTGEFAADGNYTSAGSSLQAALTGQQSAGFPTYAADTLDSGYKNLSGTAAFTTQLGGMELGARYYQASGATQYANALYNTDFTAFAGFTPLNEHFINSLFAVHASGDLTDAWHTRLTWSRIVDDLRQRQDDPCAASAVGDFDYTSRQTIDWQNDLKLSAADLTQVITFGAIIADEQTN